MRCRIPLVATLTALAATSFLLSGCGEDITTAPAEYVYPDLVGNWDGDLRLSVDMATVFCDAVVAVSSQDAASWSGTLSLDQAGPCAGIVPVPVDGTISNDSTATMHLLRADLSYECQTFFGISQTPLDMRGALSRGVLTLEAPWVCASGTQFVSFRGTK